MSTGFELDTTDMELKDLEGYESPKPGVYHLAVADVESTPISKKGDALDGIRFSFEVLAGVPGEEGKSFNELFWKPSPQAKDGGKFAMKKLARLALALELITPAQLGQKTTINWEDAKAKHLVAELEATERDGENGKKFHGCQVKGLNVWHVNDPAVKDKPKSEMVMSNFPMGPWGGNGSASKAPSTPAATGAAAPKSTAVAYDEL